MGKLMGCGLASCCTSKCVDKALLVLRIVAGIIFIVHGWGKLFGGMPGIPGFTGYLTTLGVPMAGLFAWIIGILEFFGGIALVLGIATRFVAGLLAIQMAVAFLLVSKAQLPKGDLELALFGIAFALAMGGGGAYALMRGDREVSTGPPPKGA